ncbi:MAG: YdcF family protein [Candidatus Nealsonbacteria bacterium]
MVKYDLVIVLLSQVKKKRNIYYPAPHTELKAKAASIAYQRGFTQRFILLGGYNFWVRYNEEEILKNADFSFETFIRGRDEKSEAEVVRDFMEERGVPRISMFLEETSATTQENAQILKILLKRTTFDFVKKIAILTLAYHMYPRAFPSIEQVFKEAKLIIEPLYAEDLLALEGGGIDKVCNYYSVPKGGKQWPVKRIKELLSNGKSIDELINIK